MRTEQGGSLKLEIILAIIGALGIPITVGTWVGSIQRQVNSHETRFDKAEAIPFTVTKLETEMAIVKEEVRATRADIKELTKEIQKANR